MEDVKTNVAASHVIKILIRVLGCHEAKTFDLFFVFTDPFIASTNV